MNGPESSGDAAAAELLLDLPTVRDTHALGQALGRLLGPGDVLVLTGPLGAGKTVLAQGVGAGLQVTDAVTSPTFVISRVHQGGRHPLVHVDAYRLGGLAELDDLDLDGSVEDSVTVVEWGEGVAEQLADTHLHVALDRSRADEMRSARLVGHGPGWPDRMTRLRAALRADGVDRTR